MIRPTLRMWKTRLSGVTSRISHAALVGWRVIKFILLLPLRLLMAVLEMICTPEGIATSLFLLFIGGFLIPIGYMHYKQKERDRAVAELLAPTPFVPRKEAAIPTDKTPPKVQIPSAENDQSKPRPKQPKPRPLAEPAREEDIDYVINGLGYEDRPQFRSCVIGSVSKSLTGAETYTLARLYEHRDICVGHEVRRKANEQNAKQAQELRAFIEKEGRKARN